MAGRRDDEIATASPLARHGRQRRRGAARTVASLLALTLAVGVVSAGSVAAFAFYRVTSTISKNAVSITQEGQKPPKVGAITGPVNLLLVGSDSGGGNSTYGDRGENLNDVTILVHISPVSHSVTALSIPRDLYGPQAACTRENGSKASAVSAVKFNEALSRGGLGCVAAAVTGLTGLQVDYAAKIEFDGVVAMSDAVGGVQVCLATKIDDPKSGLDLPAGESTIQGAQALAFLRTRHGLPDGSDLMRIGNQQVFMSALIRKIKSADTLTNPATLYNLATAAADNMQLSTELANSETMISIAVALKDIPADRISFVQYPSTPTYINNISVTIANKRDAKILTDAIAADQAVAAGQLGGAAVDSGTDSTATPAPTDAASAPASGAASGAPGDEVSTDPSNPVALPTSITGQSASQQTCSRGQTG
ncbi:LCP family protein [Schumannella soli]|uniref:LytR family transcriptional regulator n=1 Tax=Schumannella soli TaxID=2590779 RepID=A0A506Y127_9MICO|nr:LCP family protein [Schumannella soli]TPW74099.1 LytR family transcriptional regulator [Schumannella soli]